MSNDLRHIQTIWGSHNTPENPALPPMSSLANFPSIPNLTNIPEIVETGVPVLRQTRTMRTYPFSEDSGTSGRHQ